MEMENYSNQSSLKLINFEPLDKFFRDEEAHKIST